MLYSLSKELVGHKGCVRCVCVLKDNRIVTGGLDNQIIIWKCTNNYWKQELHLLHHNKYILALESSNSKSSDKYCDIEFYSGGLDEIIYRLSANDGKIIATYKGHQSAICNIKELSKLNIFVSGSWDGSARIWDIASSTCKHILNGHQHAVAVSIISQPNNEKYFLLTGSQNKSLHLWEIPEAKLIKTISNSHDDIIRSIGISNHFIDNYSLVAITVSNDCTIKIWQLNLKSGYENCVLMNTKRYHSSFIFDVKFSNYHNERFFTASDDCNVAIWQLSDRFEITLLQNISLQSTVWNLAEMNDIDSLLTVSEDGVCRIWATNISDLESIKFSNSKKIDSIEDTNQTGSNEFQNNEDSTDLFVEAHDISQLDLVSAEQIGTIQIFKDGDDFKAYEWTNNIWNLLGIISGINDKTKKVKYLGDEYFDCGFYDLVINVQIGIDCNSNKIPFNFGDSVIESAEKFCLREGINRKYCQAIINSIINNIPIINDSVKSFNQSFEACFEFKLFKTFNIDGLISSFKKEQRSYSNELCNSKSCTYNTGFLLDMEIEHLNDFFLRLKNEVSNEVNSVASFQIKSLEMDIIYKKLSLFIGNNSLSIPIIDLWRILAFNPQSSDIHKKSDKGWWLLALILKVIDLISLDALDNSFTNRNDEFRGSLFLICTRFLCNMFHNSTNKEVMLSKIQEIIFIIDQSITRLKERNIQLSSKENTNKNVIMSCLALMFNYIVALNNKNCNIVNSRNSIVQFVCKLIPLASCDNFMKYVDEFLHYQLLILTNNYYHLTKLDNYVDIYILEDKYIDMISDLLSKHNSSNSSKTLYYQLVISINIMKNRRNT